MTVVPKIIIILQQASKQWGAQGNAISYAYFPISFTTPFAGLIARAVPKEGDNCVVIREITKTYLRGDFGIGGNDKGVHWCAFGKG